MRFYNDSSDYDYSKIIDLSGDRISLYNVNDNGTPYTEECLATIVQQPDNTIWINGNITDIGKFLIEFIKGV
jgi:hypothetical protein